MKEKIRVVYTVEFEIEKLPDEGDWKHFCTLLNGENIEVQGVRVRLGRSLLNTTTKEWVPVYPISVDIATDVEIEIPKGLEDYKPVKLRAIGLDRPELGTPVVID